MQTVPTVILELEWRPQSSSSRSDQLLLFGQPIVDLKTNEVNQYELLLRLPGLEGCEPFLPNSFLYIAERFGLILEIDTWVVRKAITLIAACKRAGRRLTLNVNLSGKSIGDPRMIGFFEDALAFAPAPVLSL